MNTKKNEIRFYFANLEYGEFSNFAKYPIQLKGQLWPTTEHYFQAQKFEGLGYEDEIRGAKSAREAADLWRSKRYPLRGDWEEVKDSVMYDAVMAKFTQYEELKELLLSTGDAILIEHTKVDSYWADGGDGSGKNMLGKILMDVRDELNDMDSI